MFNKMGTNLQFWALAAAIPGVRLAGMV